jgi:hypothetical protein
VELANWLEAAADAAQELVSGTLAINDAAWRTLVDSTIPDGLWGAYIPLLCPGQALQLGILAKPETCRRLAQALLGMGPDEPLESDADVFDAVGEVTNLIAGGVKARVSPGVAVTLGIPLAMRGTVFPAGDSESMAGILRMEPDDLWLVLNGTRQH